jgi:hypothetical protein
MAKAPTISIITVSAFDEARLSTTLNSLVILGEEVEHLLVVPRGDLKSVSLWEEYKSDAGIQMRLLHDSNQGIYHAMNIGGRSAKGDYICFWNAGDELISPAAMRILISRLQKDQPEWLIFQGDFSWRQPLILSESEVQSFVIHNPNSFISHQCMVIKKNEFDSLQGFNTRYGIAADTAQITQLFLKVKPVFENVSVVRVETPNLAAKNHRRSRYESFIIALTSLKGSMRMEAIQNILRAEVGRIIARFKPTRKIK